jgi:hypothetical protein
LEGPLEGTLPTEIGLLTNLETFVLESTNVDGTVPSELGNLVELEVLTIARCKAIGGTLPSELANLTKVKELIIAATGLRGDIPICPTAPILEPRYQCSLECDCCLVPCLN